MEEEEENLFDAIGEGDKELVKALLQENQKMNVNFQDKVFFVSSSFFFF